MKWNGAVQCGLVEIPEFGIIISSNRDDYKNLIRASL